MWYKGKKAGYGFLTKNNGDNFEGNFLNDIREGPGSYYFKDCSQLLIGEWVDDKPKTAIITELKKYDSKVFKFPDLGVKEPVNLMNILFTQIRAERLVYRIHFSPIHLLYSESIV